MEGTEVGTRSGSYGGEEALAVRPTSEAEDLLHVLADRAEALHVAVSRLEDALAAVLRDEASVPSRSDGGSDAVRDQRGGTTVLTRDLAGSVDSVELAVERVQRLRGRLAV